MGVYLSKPVKEKISSNHENKLLKCGASSMQGWRVSQEDAHNCCLEFDSEVSLFAVYDGHGGAEVAEYASKHLPNKIKETEAYKKGDYENALKNAFLEFDATLVTDSVLEELKSIAGSKSKSTDRNSETEDETEEDDVQGLREEARMPLADVIAKYANGTLPKTPALRRIRGESSKSPYLRARPSSSGSSADSEVTSSSSSSNQDVVTNGVAEESAAETNGEKTKDNEASVSGKSTDECDEVSSSSVNGESAEGVSSSERLSAKRAVAKMFRSLLTTTNDGDESDSEDNDESFNATADTSTHQSSDEDDTENGDEQLGEDDTEDDEEEEDEDEEEEAEEEQEEDDLSESSLKETEEPGNDSGCTAVVSLVTRDRIIVANAGDSRAVLSRKGEAVDLSVDHKPEDPIELKRITGAGGKVTADGRVNGGLNLSRALGDHMYKKRSDLSAAEQMITALPDVKAMDLREGEDEFVVLACDGIWNSMSSQEVVDFVRPLIAKGETLSSICEKLFENCLAEDTLGDGTGCDNMTCVIVQLFPSDKVSSKRKCEETDSSLEETKRTKIDTECEKA
ncbi:protein phosphatase ppm-1.G isoform X2 [Halyomorpha halys]|uniref:protein phosphatase ppm-1.G isoform X2 n=1 Tax=Halyomorpha halys TaxID=286706 RepID=UPI0006D4CCE8|nr:probable protein phosphatase 2C 21 isoform X2 [Halyomorpha halys]